MKKLSKSKRSTVRFLVRRALHDLKVAKSFTFKAYGSHLSTASISLAMSELEKVIKEGIRQMQYKEKNAPTDIQNPCPAKNGGYAMLSVQSEASREMKSEAGIESLFNHIICDQLAIEPERCEPSSELVEDLGADDLDLVELSINLSEQFEIVVTDEETEHCTTYGELLNLVKAKVAAKKNNSTND